MYHFLVLQHTSTLTFLPLITYTVSDEEGKLTGSPLYNLCYFISPGRSLLPAITGTVIPGRSLLPAINRDGHSRHRAPLGPMAIDLFNVKTFAFFPSLFLPLVKGGVKDYYNGGWS
jgi:hypothetical protein